MCLLRFIMQEWVEENEVLKESSVIIFVLCLITEKVTKASLLCHMPLCN